MINDRGISPIIALVLLIAITITAGVSVYFWMEGTATKHPTPVAPSPVVINPAGNGKVLVANLGQRPINASALRISDPGLSIVCEKKVIPPGEQTLCTIVGQTGKEVVTVYGEGTGSATLEITGTTEGSNAIKEWYSGYANWAYRQKIIVYGSGTDYQIRIDLNSSNVGPHFDWNNQGIRFTYVDSSGNEEAIPYWIEYWNSTEERGIIWIRAPEIKSSTIVYMYYGNPDATSESNTNQVFIDDIPGLVGFWDFDEGSGNIVHDKSGYGNDGTAYFYYILNISNCESLDNWSGDDLSLNSTNKAEGNYSIIDTIHAPTDKYYNITYNPSEVINLTDTDAIGFYIKTNISFKDDFKSKRLYVYDTNGNYGYWELDYNHWFSGIWFPVFDNGYWYRQEYGYTYYSGTSGANPDLSKIDKIVFAFEPNTTRVTSDFYVGLDWVYARKPITPNWENDTNGNGYLYFSGVDDCVKVPYSDILNTAYNLTAISIISLNPRGPVIAKDMIWSSSSGWGLGINSRYNNPYTGRVNTGREYFDIKNGSSLQEVTYNLSLGSGWHTIFGIANKTNVTLGYDDAMLEQVSRNVNSTSSSNGIVIGRGDYAWMDFFHGGIREIALLNRSVPLRKVYETHDYYAFATPDYKGHLLVRRGYVLPNAELGEEEKL